MFSKLFHKDVFIPEWSIRDAIILQQNLKDYSISKHLKEHLEDKYKDRSHYYIESVLNTCLKTLNKTPREPFEIELSKSYRTFGERKWVVTKYCVRIPYDDSQDIVVSIRPKYDINSNLIVTAWMNSNKDHHYTLDKTKYCSKSEWDKIK